MGKSCTLIVLILLVLVNYKSNSQNLYPTGYLPETVSPNFKVNRAHLKVTLPAKYDLREEGLVTSVKYQGHCGVCWAFASLGSVESMLLKNGFGNYDLSEQSLRTCHGYESGDEGSCRGGNFSMSMSYFSGIRGPVLDSDLQYNTNENEQCDLAPEPIVTVDGMIFLPDDQNSIKQAILDYGALPASILWATNYFDNDENSLCFPLDGYAPNHGIVIIGWDDNKETQVGVGAWIIKNSWGTNWGENGYGYVSYEDKHISKNVCSFNSISEYSPSKRLYYYDKKGWDSQFGFYYDTAYGLTKYTADKRISVNSIGTYATSEGAIIKAEIYAEKNGNSLSGYLGETEEFLCQYPGYYNLNLTNKVYFEQGESFYIKVEYVTPDYTRPIPTEHWKQGYSEFGIEENVFWISADGDNWKQPNSYNLCIRAYVEDVDVANVSVGSILLQENMILNEDETDELVYRINPGYATNKELNWSSDDNTIVTVNNGVVKAVSPGIATITARSTDDSNKTATCEVRVLGDLPIEQINVNPLSLSIDIQKSDYINCEIIPSYSINNGIIYSDYDENIVSVFEDGRVKGMAAGKTTIKVASENNPSKFEIVNVTVNDVYVPMQAYSIKTNDVKLGIADQLKLLIKYLPENATPSLVFNSSNTAIAEIDDEGVITGKSLGKCQVTVSSNGNHQNTINVEVTNQVSYVTQIDLIDDITYVSKAGTAIPTISIQPTNASNKKINYYSWDPTIATFDENGVVTGHSLGETYFMATSEQNNSALDIAKIQVISGDVIYVTDLSVEKTNVVVEVGDSIDLDVNVLPLNATNKKLETSTNEPEIAELFPDGKIIGHKIGTTLGGFNSAENKLIFEIITIQVIANTTIKVTSINVSNQSVNLDEGKTVQINTSVLPTNATDKSLSYYSTNTEVASVSSNGLITGIGGGNAQIIVSSNENPNISASVDVQVTATTVKINSLDFVENEVELHQGETHALDVTILPSDATNKDLAWSSSNYICAEISSSGIITAKEVGETTINAISQDGSNVKAKCIVKVIESTITPEISVDQTSIILEKGNSTIINPILTPSDLNVTYSSSDTTVATVNNLGEIFAKNIGNTDITITALGYANISETISVTVNTPTNIYDIKDFESRIYVSNSMLHVGSNDIIKSIQVISANGICLKEIKNIHQNNFFVDLKNYKGNIFIIRVAYESSNNDVKTVFVN